MPFGAERKHGRNARYVIAKMEKAHGGNWTPKKKVAHRTCSLSLSLSLSYTHAGLATLLYSQHIDRGLCTILTCR